MNVSALMTPNPVTCRAHDPDSRAAELMWESDCGVLPVVDTRGTVLGIVTDRDLCMGASTKGRALGELCVSDAMSARVESCRPEDDVEQVLVRMGELQVRRMPVTDDRERLVGMLSLNDVFRHLDLMRDGREKQSLVQAAATCMAAIDRPRTVAVGAS